MLSQGAALLLVRVGAVVLDPAVVPSQGGADLHLPDDPAAILVRGRDQPSWRQRHSDTEGRMLRSQGDPAQHGLSLCPAPMEGEDVSVQSSGSASQWIPEAQAELPQLRKHLPAALMPMGDFMVLVFPILSCLCCVFSSAA